MTAHEIQAQDTTLRPTPETRGPQIISANGTASVHLTLAVCDYEHVREIAQGLVRADGITLTPLIFPNDSSETSHSSDLVKRKVISSIDGKISGVSVMPSARTRPCAISRSCS